MSMVTGHTAQMAPEMLAGARRLLDDVFPDMTEEDWSHCLGGMHALYTDGREVFAHAAVVQRRLYHRELVLRTGYVEGMAVRADLRRRGLGSAVMEWVEWTIHRAYELGALAATDDALPFYSARGWQHWRGASSVLAPDGVRPTPGEDGGIFVLPGTIDLDLEGELTCDWREGDAW